MTILPAGSDIRQISNLSGFGFGYEFVPAGLARTRPMIKSSQVRIFLSPAGYPWISVKTKKLVCMYHEDLKCFHIMFSMLVLTHNS
jgi:hypothetical protein